MGRQPLGLLMVLALAGCGGSVTSVDYGASEDALKVESPEKAFVSAFSAQMQAVTGDVQQVSISFSAHDGDAFVSFDGALPRSSWGAAEADLVVTTGPMKEGLATVHATGFPVAPDLGTGTVTLAFGPGVVSGEMLLGAAQARWTVVGKMYVECLVPRMDGAPVVNGTNGAGALLADETLASPSCAPFRALAPR